MGNSNKTKQNMIESYIKINRIRIVRLFGILLSLCAVTSVMLFTKVKIRQFKIENISWSSPFERKEELHSTTCDNVLDTAVIGHWVSREVTSQEVEEIDNFIKKVRDFHRVSYSVQRADGLCGNIHLDGVGEYSKWPYPYRALCDPNGSLPCCFENHCVFKPVDQCTCQNCYDMRQQIHAEFSTWIPKDPSCQILMFGGEEDTCRVLKDLTIYFIGDSFMRQLYLGVLNLVRINKPLGVLQDNTTAEQQNICDKYTRFISVCEEYIIFDTKECSNKTRLRFLSHRFYTYTAATVKYIKELKGRHNTFVLFHTGILEGYNTTLIENWVLKPVLRQLSKSPWPLLIWMSAHTVGPLKSPDYKTQLTPYVEHFNRRINKVLRKKRIPVLDFYQMTNKVMSYDGSHYGAGMNYWKAQILLNYILEVRTNTTKL